MTGIAKLAMNAQRAREMAERAGLAPEGNWKWALNKLRDGRGDLLEGRDLAEAKLGLGKLPNNVRQQVDSVARRAGYNKEISTVLKNEKGSDFNREMLQRVNTNDIKANSHIGKSRDWNDKGLVMGVGNSHSTVADPLSFRGNVTNDIHTHPVSNITQNRFLANSNVTQKNRIIENNVRRSSPYYKGDLNNLSPDEKNVAKRTMTAIDERSRDAKLGPGTVAPSGYVNPKEKRPSKAREYSEAADYKVLLKQNERNPNVKMNILDPQYGNEGVHSVRPNFVRSVYFKNQGQYK